MKVSISNICWEPPEEDKIAGMLEARGIRGVEVAPTKVWGEPTEVPDAELLEYRSKWKRRRIEIVALQALLFGKPELMIFQDASRREECLNFLSGIMRLASQLGAESLVFGSPKNRTVGDLDLVRAMDIATDFLFRVGMVAQHYGVYFCIEPNPAAYACDFIRTAAEGRAMIKRVGHPSIRLHLDSSAMTLNGECYEREIEESFDVLAHFHVSEPFLEQIGSGATAHTRIAAALRRLRYDRWVSIEMRSGLETPNSLAVDEALTFVLKTYAYDAE